MNKGVLVLIMVLIISKSYHFSDTTIAQIAKINLFSNLNRQLHSLSGTIFRSLKLGRNFTSTNKVNVLVKMADDLIKLSERKFKMYKEVRNATKIEIDNKTINPLFNLTRIVDEIFKEEHYFLRNNKFLRNNSLIEFYEAVVSNSNWLEKSLNDWEKAENNTNTPYLHRRRGSVNAFRRKYQERINKFRRRRMNELLPWRAPNQTDLPTRRIFGSEPAKIKKYPFVASLLLMGEFVCAGCIISKDMVLTAASCLQLAYKNKNFLDKRDAVAVRVGSDYPNKGGEVTPITEVYFHSKYDPVYLYSNLAVGRLEKSLNFLKAKKNVRRIQFDRDHRDMVDKTAITILGWGDQNNLNSYNGPLTMARLETYNLETCKKIYSAQYVTKTDFCAGFPDVGTGACNRDVGGPGFIGSYLVGLVNFGPPVCGTPHGPTVFTKIGNYASWIDNILAKTRSKAKIESEPSEPLKSNAVVRHGRRPRPIRTRSPKQKKSVIEKSALDLLSTIFKDLKLDVLLNSNLNFEYDLPDDEANFFEITKQRSTAGFDLNDIEQGEDNDFFTTTPYDIMNNELVSKLASDPEVHKKFAATTNPVTEEQEFGTTSHELGDLLTLPHNTNDIDPDVLNQLIEIKNILAPIFQVTTTPFIPVLKTKRHRLRHSITTKSPRFYDEIVPTVTQFFTKQPNRHKKGQHTAIAQEIYDNTSDKEKSDYPSLDKINHNIFKNWDASTNEEILISKSGSNEQLSYERRRLSKATKKTKTLKKKRQNHGSYIMRGDEIVKPDESEEIERPDFKLEKVFQNYTGDNMHAMILSAVDNNVRERDMAHYQASDEGNLEDEPSRRLLDYINI